MFVLYINGVERFISIIRLERQSACVLISLMTFTLGWQNLMVSKCEDTSIVKDKPVRDLSSPGQSQFNC